MNETIKAVLPSSKNIIVLVISSIQLFLFCSNRFGYVFIQLRMRLIVRPLVRLIAAEKNLPKKLFFINCFTMVLLFIFCWKVRVQCFHYLLGQNHYSNKETHEPDPKVLELSRVLANVDEAMTSSLHPRKCKVCFYQCCQHTQIDLAYFDLTLLNLIIISMSS